MTETILKRENGDRVVIKVNISINTYRNNEANYRVDVFTIPKGKRNKIPVYSGDEYSYRKLSMEDRISFVLEQQLQHVTIDEIYQAKLKAWETLKPPKP